MDSMLSLDSLAVAINAAHERCQRSYVTMLSDARSTGELLLQAKAQVSYGEWTTWIANHCQFSDRTAQRYMQIASSWDSLQSKTATVADLGVRMACEMIASERVLDKPDEKMVRAAVSKPKNNLPTSKDIKPGDRVAVIDPESPEHGQELEVTEVVQDAIALVKKGNETYPLLINQVEVLERPRASNPSGHQRDAMLHAPPTRQDIKPIPADVEAQHGSNQNSETTKSNTFPQRERKGQLVTTPPNSVPKLIKKEVTVTALQDVLQRILDECGEYLPQELIDEARELL